MAGNDERDVTLGGLGEHGVVHGEYVGARLDDAGGDLRSPLLLERKRLGSAELVVGREGRVADAQDADAADVDHRAVK